MGLLLQGRNFGWGGVMRPVAERARLRENLGARGRRAARAHSAVRLQATDTGPGNLHSRLAQDSSGHILDLETQIPITRSLKLEACGTSRISQPAAQYSSASGDLALDLQE